MRCSYRFCSAIGARCVIHCHCVSLPKLKIQYRDNDAPPTLSVKACVVVGGDPEQAVVVAPTYGVLIDWVVRRRERVDEDGNGHHQVGHFIFWLCGHHGEFLSFRKDASSG